MRRLCNIKPIELEVGQSGFTVRNGTKWDDIEPGDDIELCYCPNITDHTKVGEGSVTVKWSGLFIDIPAYIVEQEHKAGARTYSGLKAAMERAYGNKFNEKSFVVAFAYERTA